MTHCYRSSLFPMLCLLLVPVLALPQTGLLTGRIAGPDDKPQVPALLKGTNPSAVADSNRHFSINTLTEPTVD